MLVFLFGLIFPSTLSLPPNHSPTLLLSDLLRDITPHSSFPPQGLFTRNADPVAINITSDGITSCTGTPGTNAKCPTITTAVSNYLSTHLNLALQIQAGTYIEKDIRINALELSALPMSWIEPTDVTPIKPSVNISHTNKYYVLFTVTTGNLKLTGIGIKRGPSTDFFIEMTSTGTVEINFCYFDGNDEWWTYGCISLAETCGKTISSFGTLTISSTTFHNLHRNLKAVNGGGAALCVLGGQYTVSHSVFTSCMVNANGGAIHAHMDLGSSINNCTFTNCSAYQSYDNKCHAGAIHVYPLGSGPRLSITDCTFANNSAKDPMIVDHGGSDIQIWGSLDDVEITNCYSTSPEYRFMMKYEAQFRILNTLPVNPYPDGTTDVIIDGTVKKCTTDPIVTCASISKSYSYFDTFPDTITFTLQASVSEITETSIPVYAQQIFVKLDSFDEPSSLDGFEPSITLNAENSYITSLVHITTGSFEMSGLKIVRTSGTGWLVSLDGSGQLKLNYCVLDGNNVWTGNGAILVTSNGGSSAVVKLDSVIMQRFIRSDSELGGSCLRIDNGTVELTNSYFENNKASARGGVLSTTIANGGSITNCRFVNNEAGSGGGAIQLYATKPQPFTITNTLFVSNVVTGEGNGLLGRDILIYDGAEDSVTFSGCFTTSTSPRLTAAEVDFDETSEKLELYTLLSSITIQHGKYLSDCFSASTCNTLTQAQMFILEENTLFSIVATLESPAFVETNININTRTVLIEPESWTEPPDPDFVPTVKIEARNTAYSLVTVSTGSVEMKGVQMTRTGTQSLFFVTEGTITLSFCTFDGSNKQQSQGWLTSTTTSTSSSTIVVEHCSITKFNSSTEGGAVLASSGSLTFSSTTFSECSSERDGGVVHLGRDTIALFETVTFTSCSSKSKGGVVMSSGALFTATKCKFIENQAEFGGCFNGWKNGTQFISCHFTGNIAQIGGTMALWEDPFEGFAIKDCRFEDNTAKSDSAQDVMVNNRDYGDKWKSGVVGCYTNNPMQPGNFSIGNSQMFDMDATQIRSCAFSVFGQIIVIDSTVSAEDCDTDTLKCQTITSAFSTLGEVVGSRAVLLKASPEGGFIESKIDVVDMIVTVEPLEWTVPSNPSDFTPSIVIKAEPTILSALVSVPTGSIEMNGLRVIGSTTRSNSFFQIDGGSATLSCCVFDGDNVDCSGFPFLFHKSLSSTVMKFCTVTQFVQKSDSVDGGAILIGEGCGTISATNCVFSSNKAKKGGAFNGPKQSAQFEECRFYSNEATVAGSAICVGGASGPDFQIQKCTFLGSKALPNVGSDIHVEDDIDGSYESGIVGCVTDFIDNTTGPDHFFSTGYQNNVLDDKTRMKYQLPEVGERFVVVDSSFEMNYAYFGQQLVCRTLTDATSINIPPADTVKYTLKYASTSGFVESSIPITDYAVSIEPVNWIEPAWDFTPTIVLTKTGSSPLITINDGSLTMKDVSIKREDEEGWMVTINNGSADFSYCTFNGCGIESTEGLLFIQDEGSAILFSCLITKFNRRLSEGGAIRLNAGTLKGTNCYFTENTARLGGAISSPQSGLDLEWCWFLNNDASEGGSAIHAFDEYSESFRVHSCYFNGSRQVANTAADVSISDATDAWKNAFTGCVVDKDSNSIGNGITFLNDAKRARVGSIVTEAMEGTIGGTYDSITAFRNDFQGGYYTLTITIPTSLDPNTLEESNIPVFEQRIIVQLNSFTEPSSLDGYEPPITLNAMNPVSNSLISVTIGSFEMSGLNIVRTSGAGWLVSLDGSGQVKLKYCVLDGNDVSTGNGAILVTSEAGSSAVMKLDSVLMRKFVQTDEISGGSCVRVESGSVELTNSYFENNKASAKGGALSTTIANGGSITNCRFVNNEAGSGGGAINAELSSSSSLSITSCSFTSCSSLENGGSVSATVAGGFFTITDSTFSSTAAGNGGGLYVVVSGTGTASIAGCSFSSCSSPKGGGLFLDISQSTKPDKKDSFSTTKGTNALSFTGCTATTGSWIYFIMTDRDSDYDRVTLQSAFDTPPPLGVATGYVPSEEFDLFEVVDYSILYLADSGSDDNTCQTVLEPCQSLATVLSNTLTEKTTVFVVGWGAQNGSTVVITKDFHLKSNTKSYSVFHLDGQGKAATQTDPLLQIESQVEATLIDIRIKQKSWECMFIHVLSGGSLTFHSAKLSHTESFGTGDNFESFVHAKGGMVTIKVLDIQKLIDFNGNPLFWLGNDSSLIKTSDHQTEIQIYFRSYESFDGGIIGTEASDSEGTTLDLRHITFIGAYSEGSGEDKGAILLNKVKSANIEDCIFKDFVSTVNREETVIKITPNGRKGIVTINNCQFMNTKRKNSGAILLTNDHNGASLTIQGSEQTPMPFTSCQSEDTGGSVQLAVKGTTLIRYCVFSASKTTATDKHGGAVSASVDGGQLTIKSCSFTSCSSLGNGGAIFVDLSSLGSRAYLLSSLSFGDGKEGNEMNSHGVGKFGRDVFVEIGSLSRDILVAEKFSGSCASREESSTDIFTPFERESIFFHDQSMAASILYLFYGYSLGQLIVDENGEDNALCGSRFLPCSSITVGFENCVPTQSGTAVSVEMQSHLTIDSSLAMKDKIMVLSRKDTQTLRIGLNGQISGDNSLSATAMLTLNSLTIEFDSWTGSETFISLEGGSLIVAGCSFGSSSSPLNGRFCWMKGGSLSIDSVSSLFDSSTTRTTELFAISGGLATISMMTLPFSEYSDSKGIFMISGSGKLIWTVNTISLNNAEVKGIILMDGGSLKMSGGGMSKLKLKSDLISGSGTVQQFDTMFTSISDTPISSNSEGFHVVGMEILSGQIVTIGKEDQTTSFSKCSSSAAGGAIGVVVKGLFTVESTSFSECSSNGNGGALSMLVEDGGVATVSGCSFSNCHSDGNGGGFSLDITGSTLADKKSCYFITKGSSSLSFAECTSDLLGSLLILIERKWNSTTLKAPNHEMQWDYRR
ncbi:putative trimeric autotransporter adhesin [Blattamonas nauphoetae]|uniref:Trimeric autotransporter adhesin n=1 Tax=Blattamonas nauphoetae TaxID=2049346 RepID=A0ABQ9X216_9EUKA|nr:putative trimeric autotransporter adhesin [Blattamonas nauphoetae]